MSVTGVGFNKDVLFRDAQRKKQMFSFHSINKFRDLGPLLFFFMSAFLLFTFALFGQELLVIEAKQADLSRGFTQLGRN
ncbi:hypothetical protein VB735_13905 [Halotia wernerae UHCC 0503]|nr:hypothetical protein [Halotia wernerae UHCC 0503]